MTTVLEPRTIATTVTTSSALTSGTHTPVDATSGPVTVTLPTPPTVGAYLSVEKTDSSANTVTVSGSIRGATTTLTIAWQYESITFVWSGATWRPTEGHKTITAINTAIDGKIATQAASDSATYLPKWQASTPYLSGAYVVNPSGQIVQAISTFTSGSTYSSSNWTVVTGGPVSDATTGAKGIIQLAGDLGGTAASPTVPGLAAKAPLASAALTGTPTINGTAAATTSDVTNAAFITVPASNVTLATRTKWRKAIGGVIAGTANAKLLIVGDSTDWGIGSSGADGAPPSKSLTSLLDRSYVSAQYAFAVPPGSSAPTADVDRDDRWSKNTVDGWTDTTWGAADLGAFQHGGTSTSTAKTFTPGTSCDTFTIYYLQNTSLGSLAISVDGGTVTNQSSVGTLSIQSVTVTSTLSSAHVLSIVKSANTCFILGVKFYDSTKKSIHVLNAGVCNARAAGTVGYWSDAAAGKSLDFIGAMAPDMTIIRLGINDARLASSSSAANWETGIRAIITKAQLTGDVILTSVIPSDPAVLQNAGAGPGTAVTLEQAYRDASLNIATSTGSGYLNVFDRYGSYSAANAAGYMYDSLHLTASGSGDVAEAMRRVLVN